MCTINLQPIITKMKATLMNTSLEKVGRKGINNFTKKICKHAYVLKDSIIIFYHTGYMCIVIVLSLCIIVAIKYISNYMP